MRSLRSAKATRSNRHVYFPGKGNSKLKHLLEKAVKYNNFLLQVFKNLSGGGINISQRAFLNFVLGVRGLRACVRVHFFVWRGSIILPSDEGLSPKRSDYQRIFDTFKNLFVSK